MEYITMPVTETLASRIALGTWAIGGWMWGGSDDKESIRTIHAALELGVNLVDTAPVYGFGRSEEIVGKALKEWSGDRTAVNISTKAGLEWDDKGNVRRNADPKRIAFEVEDSLRRLKVSYIDIYFVHWPDPACDIEETATVMQQLLDQGKIKAIGVSNFSPDQMNCFRECAPIHFCQPPYNIFERGMEDNVKPYCLENNILLMTYGALCRGLLSGTMSAEREFHGDDLRRHDPKFQPPRFEQYLAAAAQLEELARERYAKDLLPLAVRWVLDQGAHIALWGGRRPEQMSPVREVLGWNIDSEGFEQIDRILEQTVTDPVGPEFMAPPSRK